VQVFELNIPRFADLIRSIKVNSFKDKMSNLETTIPRKASAIIPCLTLESEALEESDPTSLVTFQLKVRAGSGTTASSYKKQVRRFDEGSPPQYIRVLEAYQEIWKQNSITSPSDRLATVRTILRGDSLVAFETSIVDNRDGGPEGQEEVVLTTEIVEEAMNAVSESVFPHRALEHQKLWMRRHMRKPRDMTARKLAAPVCRINNSLPLFPGGSSDDKFSDSEIIELLEFSVPEAWRTKFDLEGYIPSEENKAAFITHCEVLERHENVTKKPKEKVTVKKAHKSAGKNKSREGKKSLSGPFHCKEHGENPTHDTANCYTLKNRAAKGGNSSSSAQRTFTSKKFRKEIHSLFKKQPKKKVLDMFASVIQSEQAAISKKQKAVKQKKRRVIDTSESESESDDDLSVQVIEVPQPRAKKIARAKKLKHKSELHAMESDESDPSEDKFESNATDEEQTFQRTIASLGSAPCDIDEVSSSDCDE
jgi:hypothetical protein